MRTIGLAFLVATLSGCATFESADHVNRGSPRFFAGTRLDLAAMNGNDESLGHFKKFEMTPPGHPAADLPFSFVADVITFPVAASYTLTEPLLYAK